VSLQAVYLDTCVRYEFGSYYCKGTADRPDGMQLMGQMACDSQI